MGPTSWDSIPDYDNWGPDTWWSCEDWIQWHRLLVRKFGKEKAKIAWDYAFAKSGMGSGNLDCRTFNSNFRSYVAQWGLDPFAGAGVFTPILKLYGGAADTVSNVGGLFSGTKGKVITYTLIGILVVIGTMVVYKKLKA
jgi:hypothetical protein